MRKITMLVTGLFFVILLLGGFSLCEPNLKVEKAGNMRVQPGIKQMTGMTDQMTMHDVYN